MARSHPVAVAIKQQAGEQARLRCSSASVALGGVAGEPRLNGIPQLPIDDWRVFAGIGPFLVNDLAPVDAGSAASGKGRRARMAYHPQTRP